jgi:hypothetical protein
MHKVAKDSISTPGRQGVQDCTHTSRREFMNRFAAVPRFAESFHGRTLLAEDFGDGQCVGGGVQVQLPLPADCAVFGAEPRLVATITEKAELF